MEQGLMHFSITFIITLLPKKFFAQNSWPISTDNLQNFFFCSLKLIADFNASFAF